MPQIPHTTEKALPTRATARLNRVRLLGRLLDEQFRIPGTRQRIGLDGLLGLIPGVGDMMGTLLSVYILYEAIQLGVPRHVLLRMVANIGLDAVVGAIPLAGDIFDVVWKANTKNITLLQDALRQQQQGST